MLASEPMFTMLPPPAAITTTLTSKPSPFSSWVSSSAFFTWPAAYNQSGQCNTIVKISSGAYTIATPYNCSGKKVQVGG